MALVFIVQGLLAVPIEGSITLFLAGTALHLFATTALGIFLATTARSMPQFDMLMMLVLCIGLSTVGRKSGATARATCPFGARYLHRKRVQTLARNCRRVRVCAKLSIPLNRSKRQHVALDKEPNPNSCSRVASQRCQSTSAPSLGMRASG
ncbi:MAG: hypothetical protein HOP18_03830 [Deltaproteobacteria bacterium]|nr:hypothetical protein [Deltaproteobacteria bacterium]